MFYSLRNIPQHAFVENSWPSCQVPLQYKPISTTLLYKYKLNWCRCSLADCRIHDGFFTSHLDHFVPAIHSVQKQSNHQTKRLDATCIKYVNWSGFFFFLRCLHLFFCLCGCFFCARFQVFVNVGAGPWGWADSMSFTEGCSSPSFSSVDGASLKTSRGLGNCNTLELHLKHQHVCNNFE